MSLRGNWAAALIEIGVELGMVDEASEVVDAVGVGAAILKDRKKKGC